MAQVRRSKTLSDSTSHADHPRLRLRSRLRYAVNPSRARGVPHPAPRRVPHRSSKPAPSYGHPGASTKLAGGSGRARKPGEKMPANHQRCRRDDRFRPRNRISARDSAATKESLGRDQSRYGYATKGIICRGGTRQCNPTLDLRGVHVWTRSGHGRSHVGSKQHCFAFDLLASTCARHAQA